MAYMTNSIFQPFEPIKYLYTSFFELEINVLTASYDKLRGSDDLRSEDFIRRNLNLREIINLQLAERAQRMGFRNIDNKIYLGDIKDLANFITFKIKTSNIFNVTLSLKNEEENEEPFNMENIF